MSYNYDFFVSYSHEDDKDGFVTKFVEQLKDHTDFETIFGGKPRVFIDQEKILTGDEWERKIRECIRTSRFLITLLSPNYFKSKGCADEFDWWVEFEKHNCVLGNGILPIQIIGNQELINGADHIAPDLQNRFPNWVSEVRRRQIYNKSDLITLDRTEIAKTLAALYDTCREKVWRQNSALKSRHNYSYPNSNKNFVGRLEELRSLHDNLETHRHVALYGLGGVGKTELALMYGRAFAWDYQLGRVYIGCENQTSLFSLILGSGLDLINDVKFEKDDKNPLATLFNALHKRRNDIIEENEKNGRPVTLGAQLLLILDNVNKIEILNERDLAKLPDYVHVVATTQENPANFAHLHGRMSVDSLSDSEALELLRVLRPFDDDDERQAAEEIIRLFGGHAFRVEKIGAYLRRNKWEKYRNFLKKAQQRFNDPERLNFLEETISTKDLQTRHIAIPDLECLRPTLERLTPNAKTLLDWAALFGPDSVPVPWLGELANLEGEDLRKGLQELEDYRLLIPLEADSKEQTPRLFDAKQARLHRIAREVVAARTPRASRLSAIEQINKKVDEFLSEDFERLLSRNTRNISLLVNDILPPVSDNVAWCRISAADFCYDRYLELKNQGPSEYEPHLIRRLNDLCRGLPSDRRREISQASIVLGQRWVAAEPDSPEALKALGVSFAHLGNSLWSQDFKQARECFEKAAEILGKELERKPDDSGALYRLGHSYIILGNLAEQVNNYEQAREDYEKAVENFEKALERNPGNSFVLYGLSDSCNILGNLAKRVNNYEQARENYEKAVEIWKEERERKPNDYDVLESLNYSYKSLGELAKSTKDYEQAREYYEKRLELWKKELERKPDRGYALLRLHDSYESLGELAKWANNYEQAKDYYEKRLEVWKEVLERNPDYSYVLDFLSNSYKSLGKLAKSANDYDQARGYYKKELETRKQFVEQKPGNPYALLSLRNSYNKLGDLLKEQGDLEQGKKYEEKAAEIDALLEALKAKDNR